MDSEGGAGKGGNDAAPDRKGVDAAPGDSSGVKDTGGSKGEAGPAPVARPSYNTGNGFFIANGKLYDANGYEFRIRGVDRAHYDPDSQAGIAKGGANTVRIFVETNYGATVSDLVNVVQTQHINQKQVPIPTSPSTTDGAATSCSTDTTVLSSVVANWVATASSWTPLDKYSIINIANEWGPANSTVGSSNVSAVASLRTAGYLGTILVDSGGCGQDPDDLLTYASDVLGSDPQKNVMFAYHDYSPASSLTYFPQFAALAASAGVVIAVTEFGPGNDIGPSPTTLTPLQIITAAETNNLGWLAWAWDDNNLTGGQTNNEWFGMTYNGPGIYTKDADLTMYGQQNVEGCTNPTPGGCGCPDGLPLPAFTEPTPPAVYAAVEPGCTGAPAPTYTSYSLKLAVPATVF